MLGLGGFVSEFRVKVRVMFVFREVIYGSIGTLRLALIHSRLSRPRTDSCKCGSACLCGMLSHDYLDSVKVRTSWGLIWVSPDLHMLDHHVEFALLY